MKTVYFMRHAKAEKAGRYDFDRVLSDRGVSDAGLIGRLVSGRGIRFDGVFSSAARRTLMTAELVAEEASSADIVAFESLYNAGAWDILDFASRLDENLKSPLIVAHNPGVWDIYDILSGEPVSRFATGTIFGVSVEHFADLGAYVGVIASSQNHPTPLDITLFLEPKQHRHPSF